MGDTSQIALNVKIERNEINTEETNEINKNVLPIVNVTNKPDNKSLYTEVISIDDSDDENSNSVTEPTCYQEDNSHEIAASSSAFHNEISNSSKSENEKKFYIIYQRKLCMLTKDAILKGIEEQSKSLKNKSDSLLNKIIRTQHPEYYTHMRTVHENLIYNAIEYWKHWCESKTKLKNTPVLYKCYICNEGWCRLHPFGQHITIHKDKNLIVSLEEIGQEANIIATYGNPKESKPVIVNSDCWKCNKTFQNREFTKYSMKSHICESCQIQLPSMGLQQSYSTRILCTICSMYCSNEDIYSHMVLYHTPKSDEPAVTYPKICTLCEEKYYFVAYHDCPKRFKYYECKFCWNRFLTKPLQQLHMKMNKGVGYCPDCSKKFTKCHLIEHLLVHSSNYDVLQYCVLCKNNILYNNNDLFTSHMINHGNSTQRQRYTAKMLLPFKCIKGVICDSVSPLQVPVEILNKYMLDLDYMSYTPPELIDIIKSKKTKELTEAFGSKIEGNTNKTLSLIKNKCKNLEKSVISKKITEKLLKTSTVNNSQDEIEFDDGSNNDAFEEQLDAEIQRDVEIEKELSKVFEASNCYKKFLDKEANDPIDDTYGLSMDKMNVLNIDDITNSDTNSEENSDMDSKNEKQSSDVDFEYDEIFDLNVETNVDKMKACGATKEKSKQEVKEIDKENLNITEPDNNMISNNICGSEIEKSYINKEMNENVTSDCLKVDKLDFQTESSVNKKIDTLNKESDGISDDIVVPDCSQNLEMNAENITLDPKYSCSDCNYTGCYNEYVDHTISCTNKHTSCIYCMKSFQNVKSFLAHFPEHNLTYLSCPQCLDKFNDILSLKEHILTHIYGLFHLPNSEQYYKIIMCTLCEELVDIDNLFIHWESHLLLNEGNMDIDDEVELKKLMTPEMVKQAIVILSKIRNRISLTCMVCKKIFTTSIKFKRHLIEHLLYEVKMDMLNGAKLSCPKCHLDIHDIDTWKVHMQEHSHLHKTYFCKSCRKSFKDPIIFDRHKEVHKLKYICDLCDKKFFLKSLIIQHLANHEPFKIFTCQICDETFHFESKLKSHDCRPFLRFSCTHCDRKFRTPKDKLNHLWNEHKFSYYSSVCTLCDTKHRRLTDLRDHMKVKHGIKRNDEFNRLRQQSTTKGKKKKRQTRK